jgi:hypothetical protein
VGGGPLKESLKEAGDGYEEVEQMLPLGFLGEPSGSVKGTTRCGLFTL